MGIENYDFDHQKIKSLVNQFLNQVIVQEFNKIQYDSINQQLTIFFFEPKANDQTLSLGKVFLRIALISKELFRETLHFNKIQ
jgi:hypothetical protein